MSRFHLAATISTGGAAKWVRVPPMDTFTNNAPNAAYCRRRDAWANTVSFISRAASVMAAGSVMKEPSSGTMPRTVKKNASGLGKGITRASACTAADDTCSTGLLAATTMMANTNRGSVKFRPSR